MLYNIYSIFYLCILTTKVNLHVIVNFLSAVNDSSRVNGRSYHRCLVRFTYTYMYDANNVHFNSAFHSHS